MSREEMRKVLQEVPPREGAATHRKERDNWLIC